MLSEAITSAQHNNPDSLLALIEKFKPLLKKYAYKLHYAQQRFILPAKLEVGSHVFRRKIVII